MDYIKGTPRKQLFMFNNCLDDIIEDDNPVRVMDAYVESLDLGKLSFKMPELRTGTPPYRPQLLLKIYVYGYYERTRSSRRLEKECNRNKELIWLTEGLAPDFKTIADFRKNNREGIKNVFREFLNFCNSMGLLSFETVAIDGTKLRAQNSLNNIYKRDEIDKVSDRIQKKIDEYLSLLDIEDEKEADDLNIKEGEVQKVVKKLKKLKKYQNNIEEVKKLFEEDKELKTYFSTDKDSRFQSDCGKVRAGYNAQIAGDDKNKLIIANDVTNESNDEHQMTPMVDKVRKVKDKLGIEKKTKVGLDSGYFNEQEILNNIDDNKIEVIVPDKKEASKKNKKKKKDKIPSRDYEIDNFKYNKEENIYRCPEGKTLRKTHDNPGTERSGRKVFEYQCYDCADCDSRTKCTKNKKGRSIKVSVNREYIESYKESTKTDINKKIINKRKEIIEHPFGTIKKNLGYTYFMQRGIENVKSEFSFICFVYNLKRILNIFTVNELIIALKQ